MPKLSIYVLDLDTEPFPVTIKASQIVHDLAKSILNAKPLLLEGLDVGQLGLYKAKLTTSKLPDLAGTSPNREDRLSHLDSLSTIFPETPPISTISILVELPDCELSLA